MLKAGMTGNMGSGKSTVASVFRSLGIPVYQADEAAKRMYLRPDILRYAIELAGEGIIDAGGCLNRRALALQLFSDSEKLERLTALIHPLVREDFANWLKEVPNASYVIHEAAILYESGYEKEFDTVIHVSCPEEVSIARIGERDGLSPEEIRLRMQYQFPDEVKCSRADFVILNDGSEMVIPQVLRIHEVLLKSSA